LALVLALGRGGVEDWRVFDHRFGNLVEGLGFRVWEFKV